MSTEKFIIRAKLVHGNRYDYSTTQYVNAKNPVSIICLYHGQFFQRPDLHLGGRNCPLCGYEQRAISRRNRTDWLSFDDAKKIVHSYNFATISEWNIWSKNERPPNIPACPKITYKKDWMGWIDWLGNKIEWLSYNEAKQLVHIYNLRSCEDWKFFCTELKLKPENIPYEPKQVYKKEWVSWGDWLGYSSRANGNLSGIIYIIQQNNLPNNVIKVGRTYRLDKRIYEHKRLHQTDIKVLKTFSVDNMKQSEELAHIEILTTEKYFKYYNHEEYFEVNNIEDIINRLEQLLTPIKKG